MTTFRSKGRGRSRRVYPITPRRAAATAHGSAQVVLPRSTPEQRFRKYGTAHPVDELAEEMGYARVSDVPESREREFAEKLSRRHGKKRARGMLIQQIVYRKHHHRELAEKLRRILEHIPKES